MSDDSSGALSWWTEAARPRTLPAAVAPVLVASALAANAGSFALEPAAICLAFALLIQIGTNFANDYFDFKKGADNEDRVGPRRAVAAGLISPAAMKRAMTAVFALAFLVGLSLLPYGGWPLLLVGITSIFCGVVYTGGPYPLAYHGWGDVFVFVFFGLVAVTATYFVQAGEITPEAWFLGAAMGALSTNILIVNNYRDVETDRAAGKRTLVVRFGQTFARRQFAFGHGVMASMVLLLILRRIIGPVEGIAVALIGAWLGFRQMRDLRAAESPAELIALLGRTGRHLALMAMLVAIALVL
ncbi:MAG: 1,4-dihydroxy-2-naphthoate polyprenyltransferase [Synoicihabitans sp.]